MAGLNGPGCVSKDATAASPGAFAGCIAAAVASASMPRAGACKVENTGSVGRTPKATGPADDGGPGGRWLGPVTRQTDWCNDTPAHGPAE